MENEKLLTAVEVGAWFQVKPETVLGWARDGRIPAQRMSSRMIRFRLSEVSKALGVGQSQANPV